MQNKVEMVVFDMAGTTVDENNIVYKVLRKAINNAGYEVSLEDVLAHGAGMEKKAAIKSVLLNCENVDDDALATSIFEQFLGMLTAAYEEEELFPQNNAKEVFVSLKERGILAVLNTGYDRPTAESIIKKLGWQEGVDFDALVTASDVGSNRPHPDMIHYAMRKFDIADGNKVVKVGDSTIDVQEGQNAGCVLSIGITTGAHTAEQLREANPDKIINNLIELLPLL